MKIEGSCHCGFLQYEADVDPRKTRVCYCTDCQVMGGGAFRGTLPVAREDFYLTAGEPACYVKTTADSGEPRAQIFCPRCGTHLYATGVGDAATVYNLRPSTSVQRDALMPQAQVWTRSRPDWLADLTDLPGHEMGG